MRQYFLAKTKDLALINATWFSYWLMLCPTDSVCTSSVVCRPYLFFFFFFVIVSVVVLIMYLPWPGMHEVICRRTKGS
jgi:hypothetical protein